MISIRLFLGGSKMNSEYILILPALHQKSYLGKEHIIMKNRLPPE